MKEKFENWLFAFIHSPAAFEGRDAQAILDADITESKKIFAKELSKRKAQDSFKTFQTKDGLELSYWFVEKAANDKVKILLHGSGSNFAKADRAVYLLDRGFNVAMISYRGHSGNPGKADQKLIIKDVIAAVKNIMELGYTEDQLYLEGSSLGTCVLAHALTRMSEKFAGLLLKAAPLHLCERDEYTIKSLKDHGLEFGKVEALLRKVWNQEQVYLELKAAEVVIVHGTKDDVVPVEHATKIKSLLEKKNDNLSLHLIDGEGHRLDLNSFDLL